MSKNFYETTDARKRRQNRTKREAELYRAIRYLEQVLGMWKPASAAESATKLAARSAADDALGWYADE